MFNSFKTNPKQAILADAKPWIEKMLQCDYEIYYCDRNGPESFNFILNNDKAYALGLHTEDNEGKKTFNYLATHALQTLFKEFPEYDIFLSKTGRVVEGKYRDTFSFMGKTMRKILYKEAYDPNDIHGPAKVRDELIKIFNTIYPVESSTPAPSNNLTV